MLDNKFLVNLKATYKDEYRVYFLLEVCLGGELFTILRKMRSFDEPTARFYSSCVIEAFDYCVPNWNDCPRNDGNNAGMLYIYIYICVNIILY